MPDRNKILIGAGVVWAISVCCLLWKRKVPPPAALLSFIPSLSDDKKMEDEGDQKGTDGNAGPSVKNESSIPNENHENSSGRRNGEMLSKILNVDRQWAPNFMTGASPPKFVSLEEIVHAANGMKNMALAHEIAVDKNFQLQKLIDEEGDSLQKRVKDIVHKAFWQVLADQLAEDPPNYTQALVLLKEIKECLSELVMPHHTKIRDNIKEILDVELIEQQAKQGILDFQHYSRYVLATMGKLCAPVRDERIKELCECTDVIETFKGIMEVLQLMRLDLANFTITMMRPNIVASSIEYEKTKFAEFLKVQADGLQYTRKWLLKNFDEEKKVAASTDPNGLRQVTHNLLAEAYLDLLEWDSSPDAETLMLDQGRLLDLRDKTSSLTIIGSILLMVNNTIGASIQGIASFKKNIKEHLAVLLEPVHSNRDLEKVMPNIVLQVKKDVNTTLKGIDVAEMSPAVEGLLDGQIQDLVNEDHKIRHLVTLRIREFLQKIILTQSAVHQQIPPGLSSLQEELASIAARFLILVAHNRSVFGEYYQKIVADEVANENKVSTGDETLMEA